MKSFFEELFDYNFAMNQGVISKFHESSEIPEKAKALFNHILSAHHIWNHRIMNDKAKFSVWPDLTKEKYAQINDENHKQSLELLKHRTLDEKITYSNSKGEVFSNTVKDIFFHIINHSNYHRAQIATLMKEAGIKPLVSDYIFYKR